MAADITVLQQHLARQAGNSRSLTQRKAALIVQSRSNILLLDKSSSMSFSTDANSLFDVSHGNRRIDRLWEVIQSLRAKNIHFRVCEFGNDPEWSDSVVCPDPFGSTNLTKALEFVRSENPSQILLISDGEPDNADSALELAMEMRVKVNVFFVGPNNSYDAIAFCQRLASITGGTYNYGDISTTQNLIGMGTKIEQLLLPGAGETTQKGAIQL